MNETSTSSSVIGNFPISRIAERSCFKIIEQEYNDKFGTIEELDNKIKDLKSEKRDVEKDKKELEKDVKILNVEKGEIEKDYITLEDKVTDVETKLKNAEQEYKNLSNINELLKKADEILENNNKGTILYISRKVGPLRDRKTVYEVPEEELKALLNNCETRENLLQSMAALEVKNQELDERETIVIYDARQNDIKRAELNNREKQLKQKEQELEKQKSELALYIEEKAKDLLEAFLSEHPHIRKTYYDFLKVKRIIAPPKKYYYQSHDFDR